MIRTRYLYVMVSQTGTGVGRLIRAVSGYPYNHVSVALDLSEGCWYSFARYVHSAPLFGGFICEGPQRFCGEKEDSMVRIYRTEIPEIRAAALERLLPVAGDPESGLIYNHFDALAGALGFHISVPRCHTCLSFACEILDQKHETIDSLCRALEPCLIYEGSFSGIMPRDEKNADGYLTRMGMLQSGANTLSHLGTLTMRTIHLGCQLYWEYISRRFAR